MKIVLAVDGSRSSLDAVDNLIEHVSWFRETPEVELITVRAPVPKLPRMGLVVSKAQIQRYYQEEGATCLAAAKKKLEAAKLKYRAEVLVGPIAETIVGHAKKLKADLIFVGTRGMTATANALLGSVATKVLHISPVPVLLVK
jgi:nucleotide-binding universal stress UspA family protein